jgi:hypothetical protein
MPMPSLLNERWQLDNPFDGLGSLTVSGQGFLSGGSVRIVYDYGGGQYQRFLNANIDGQFTVTEPFIYCGDIPGMPGVGVIVTATDIASGLQTTEKYATPC